MLDEPTAERPQGLRPQASAPGADPEPGPRSTGTFIFGGDGPVPPEPATGWPAGSSCVTTFRGPLCCLDDRHTLVVNSPHGCGRPDRGRRPPAGGGPVVLGRRRVHRGAPSPA